MLMVDNLVSARNEKLALDDDERELIGGSLKDALRYENIPLSPRAQAWSAFTMAVGSVYGGKIMAGALKRDRPVPVAPPGMETNSSTKAQRAA